MSFDPLTMTEKKPAAIPVDLHGRFFGLANRLKRTFKRYWMKKGVFAILSGISFLLWIGIAYCCVAAISGKPPLVSVSLAAAALILTLVQMIVQIAVAAAAAFKIKSGQALSVGLTRLIPCLKTEIAAVLMTFLASLALLVPGLILKLRFSLLLPAMLSEQGRGVEPLVKSRDLVHGRTAAMLVSLLTLGAPLAAIATICLLPLRLSQLIPADLSLPWLSAAAGKMLLLSSPAVLVMSLLLPLLPTFLQIFYEDAVGDKEPTPANAKKVRHYKRLATAGAIVVVLLAAVVIGLPLILARTRTAAVKAPSGEEQTAASSAPTAPPKSPEEERDWQRYSDTNVLRIALNSYLSENGEYPNKLEDLVPDFIPGIPFDPKTRQPYEYVRTASGYRLAFDLERGVMILAPGRHVLSTKGMDIPEQAAEPPAPNSLTAPSSLPDGDSDGLPDEEEVGLGTDPKDPDTDGDGINDGDEAKVFKTDPAQADTDSDGANDWEEVYGGFNPLVKEGRLTDSDNDGLADVFEAYRRLDPNDPDMDKDGLADGDEMRVYGTDAQRADSDHDDFNDGEELRGGFEPLGAGRLQQFRQMEIKKKAEKYGLHPPTNNTLAP